MNHFKTKKNKREKLRGIYFQLGLIIAGGLTLLAFEWTFPIHTSQLGGVIIDEIVEDFEWTPPVEKEKVEEITDKKEEVKLITELFKKVENDFKEKEIDKKVEKTPEKTPEFKEGDWKEVEKVKEEAPMPFAESMPYYSDCKDLNETERKKCTQENMYKHY